MNRFRWISAACALMVFNTVTRGAGANTNEALKVALELTDGSRLIGTPGFESVPLRTAYAKMDIPLKQVLSTTMEDDRETSALELRNGDKMRGVIGIGALTITTVFGKMTIPIEHIRTLHVSIAGGGYDLKSLVFWNKLGSKQEVLNSAAGPALLPYEGGHWPEVAGDREFVPGKHGAAVTIKGAYQNMSRVHNLVLKNLENLLNPESGCIEAWYYQEEAPVAYAHGVYRIFDGPYGLGSGVSLYVMPEGLSFSVGFGGQGRGVNVPVAQLPSREWLHVAGAWDRQGLDGSTETIRLYVNGRKVAAAGEKDWGTSAAGQADIAGSNDDRCAGKFRVDNLKIWNRARTSFSDRDGE